MAKIVWVDLPDPKAESANDPWICVLQTDNRKDAERFLETRYGIVESEWDTFISEGEE